MKTTVADGKPTHYRLKDLLTYSDFHYAKFIKNSLEPLSSNLQERK